MVLDISCFRPSEDPDAITADQVSPVNLDALRLSCVGELLVF